MQGLFAFFVLNLFQKVFPENERVEESECENREGGEEKKDSWTKLRESVGKPLYGNIALIAIQILLFAVTSAATLQQEWFIEAKPLALGCFLLCGEYVLASIVWHPTGPWSLSSVSSGYAARPGFWQGLIYPV